MQDIDYDYDSVSNITNIANSAPMMPNGLGGTYSQSFSYDNLYRLTGSSGIWASSDSLDYHTETEYHANGRIKQKQVTAKVLSNGHVSQISYDNGYYYDNLQQPNTLSRISAPEVVIPGISFRKGKDRSSSPVVHFSWDATGNMVSQDPAGDAGRRFLCWDEQNRLQGVVDGKHLSYYLYDANGDRAFKLTGKGDLQNISGTWQYYYLLENATLYASPYLVATDKGYTKHYYAESERITSKIGGGGLTEFGHPLLRKESFVNKMKANSTMMDKVLVGCLNAKYYEVKPVLQHLYDWQDSVQPEDNCYWYHPDHLGSSSWITYSDGKAVQHLHYLPWGEDFVNQRTGSFSSMYTFSAKEKDTETGYSYFGVRYYSSDLSVWLSVDPKAEKYPSLSSYAYCADNPVKYIDPNGETPIAAIMEGIGAFMVSAGLDFLNNWLVYGQDYSTAFNNVSWGTAAIDGVTTFLSSFFLSGTGSAKFMSKISNSKLTHFAIEIFKCMVTNVTAKIESGTKFKDINLIEELLYATFSSLVGNGMEKRADELLKRVHSTNQSLYNKCLKQERNIKAQKNDARLRSDARQVNISKQAANRAGADYAREQTKNAAVKNTATQATRDIIDGIKDTK